MQTEVRAVTTAPPPVPRAGAVHLALLAAAWSLILGGGCRPDPAPPAAKTDQSSAGATVWLPPSESGFVGSEACAACHQEISDAYGAHPMARSMRAVDVARERLLVDGIERVAAGSRTYEVRIKDGRLFHHEIMSDAAGEPIYDHAVPMDYVVGSGRRAFAYLTQQDDLLFMSPLNFYTGAQKWDLAPSYEPDDPRRFDRRVTEECVSCHAGRVATAGRQVDRFRKPAFEELGIGCERCHGPGGEHIALHEGTRAKRAAEDPIVNPRQLDPDRRESVCYQCHLSAEVRVPRHGRSDLDFRPGDRLDDIWTVLVGDSGKYEDGKARAVSHVQQMRQSECFAGSDGALGCISCHDPHRVPAAAERVEFFRARCLTCHEGDSCSSPQKARLQRDDSCIACHMPLRGTSNVAHVTLTDHRILRDEPPESEPPADAGDTLRFFDDSHRRLAGWEQTRAMGVGAWVHLRKQGQTPAASVARLLAGVLKHAPQDPVVLTVLAAMALDHNRSELARTYYLQAVNVPAAREMALLGLLKIDYLAGRHAAALDWADQLLAINPGQSQAHAMRADVLRALDRLPEAIAAAEKALELNPTLIVVRAWLAEAYARAGQPERQREQQEIIRRMEEAASAP